MRSTAEINVVRFSRQDYIYIGAFAVSSFFQAIVVTLQGPSYGSLFHTNNGNGTSIPRPRPDAIGTVPISNSPIAGEANDFSATFFGFVLAVYQLFSFILTPIIGIYVESIGMKRVYMFGIYVAGFSPFLSIFVNFFTPNSSMYLIVSFIVRGVEAVGGVGMQVAMYMMITVLFPGRIATIFALNQAMTVFGMALGGPITFIIQRFGGFALPSTTFLTMGLVFTGFVLLVKRVLPNLPPRETLDVTTRELLIRFYKFLKVPPILLFELSIIITGIGSAFLQAIIAPDLTDLNVGPWGVALIPLLPSLLQLISPVWGYALDRIRNGEVVALIGSLIAVLSLLIIGPVPFIPLVQDLYLTCFGLTVFGFGQGAIIVSSYVLLIALAAENDSVPDDMITTTIISTSYVGAVSLGSGLSAILSSVFYDNYGFQAATLFPFSLYTFLTVLLIIYAIFNHRNPRPFVAEYEFVEREEKETSPLLRDHA